MNIITRSLAAKSRKPPLLLFLFQQHSSLYSSTSTPTTSAEQQSYVMSPDNFTHTVRKKAVDWPRPTEIPWQPKVANSVNLIGYVQIPVQFKTSPDGKYWAGTVISQQHVQFQDSPQAFWIPVIFEGDLAHIAACHLKEKDCVHIAGQLSADPPPFTSSQGQANVQVMAHSINFVEGSPQPKKRVVPSKQEERPSNRSDKGLSSTVKDRDFNSSSWRDLLKNSKQWIDHRENKLNGMVKPKHPDFKHKDTGAALWLSDAPTWVLPGLEGLEFEVPPPKMKQVRDNKDLEDDPWENLVKNPNEWWDNRSTKVNKNAPDFKHKDTGVGLWVNSSPAWALSKLPPLKANLD